MFLIVSQSGSSNWASNQPRSWLRLHRFRLEGLWLLKAIVRVKPRKALDEEEPLD